MIGLVVVTHGRLAEELMSATEHVVGPQKQMKTVCIGPDDDLALRRADIREAAAQVDSGDGVILLTDMFGGTPSNLSISILEENKVEVIAGVNLPMLIKLAEARVTGTIAEAAEKAQDAGRKYIAIASQILTGGSGQ